MPKNMSKYIDFMHAYQPTDEQVAKWVNNPAESEESPSGTGKQQILDPFKAWQLAAQIQQQMHDQDLAREQFQFQRQQAQQEWQQNQPPQPTTQDVINNTVTDLNKNSIIDHAPLVQDGFSKGLGEFLQGLSQPQDIPANDFLGNLVKGFRETIYPYQTSTDATGMQTTEPSPFFNLLRGAAASYAPQQTQVFDQEILNKQNQIKLGNELKMKLMEMQQKQQKEQQDKAEALRKEKVQEERDQKRFESQQKLMDFQQGKIDERQIAAFIHSEKMTGDRLENSLNLIQARTDIKAKQEFKNMAAGLNFVDKGLDAVVTTMTKIPAGRVSGGIAGVASIAFSNKNIAQYDALKAGLLTNIARNLGGEKGAISDPDIVRITAGFPKITDSIAERAAKIATIKSIIVSSIQTKAAMLGQTPGEYLMSIGLGDNKSQQGNITKTTKGGNTYTVVK